MKTFNSADFIFFLFCECNLKPEEIEQDPLWNFKIKNREAFESAIRNWGDRLPFSDWNIIKFIECDFYCIV